ncbi:LysR substrate-binding domain-containing protein [Dechloromonas sp. ARDL1]|uniref:LysR substrate-binding domain-containing protein n=1 Tax=Dechloromonas sp. ARDL1 TaxID=3322121 RepID=UPI003DA7602F
MDKHGYGSNNLRIPPITGLMAFESVARNGSFSKAADELSITQSAVSHRISQLESLVGASLLIRIGHSVSLAPAGKELLPYVREGLGSLRDGLANISTEGKPSLKLSLAPAVAANWLIQRLSGFHRKHPDINLEINVTSKNINLRSGEADVAIRCGDGRWDGLDAIELIPLREVAVCSPAYQKAHPWLRRLEDMERATLLRHNLASWKNWFAGQGIDMKTQPSGVSFSEVSLLITAAECSQGMALVYDVLVERQLQDGTLVQPVPHSLVSERSYHIVTPTGAPRSPALQAFIDWLLTLKPEPKAR